MALTKKAEIVPIFKLAHEKECLCCKYSPNKEVIAAGYTDGVIRLYQTRSGASVINMSRHADVPVTSLHFRGSSKPETGSKICLSTYTDGRVILWDIEHGKKIKEITEQRQTLGSVYHPKLHKFLTVGDDGAIHLYDEETMQLEQKYMKGISTSGIDGHTSRVFAALFHPIKQSEFVSGGWDSVVHFWDIRQPNSIRFIKGIHMCGEGFDINSTGREMLTCSYSRDDPIQLWHYDTGRLLANVEPDPHKSMLYCGKWASPDHLVLGGTDPSLLRVVSLKKLTTVYFYKGSSTGVYSVDSCQQKTKREIGIQIKIVFSIDKSLTEAKVTL